MAETFTISLTRPLAGCHLVDSSRQPVEDASELHLSPADVGMSATLQGGHHQILGAIEEREQNLTQLCETLDSIARKLNDLYQETITRNRSDIAKLAVEIARKILNWKADTGDYSIQGIIEEALKRAPTRQELVVHVNPEDLPRCQELQQELPDSQFAELNLVADPGLARAGCLVETPKGIVRSFVEEHLDRIAEALEKAQ